MKIIVDDQYNNDENKEYTVDKDGNVNLFINIGDDIDGSDGISINNNINSNDIKEEIDNNSVELEEEQGFGDALVINNSSDSSRIDNESSCGEDNYSKNYHSIYAEIENSLQQKYAEKEPINDNIYNERKEETVRDNIYNERKEGPVRDNIYNERIEPISENVYNERNYNIYDERYDVKPLEQKGVIDVYSKLGSKEGIELRGARINLYLLNGVTPKLYDSKFTDEIGKVSFDNLSNGCYRVIAIVDRRYFEKPIYYNWNEVTIDRNNKHSSIVVVNKIKPGYYRR